MDNSKSDWLLYGSVWHKENWPDSTGDLSEICGWRKWREGDVDPPCYTIWPPTGHFVWWVSSCVTELLSIQFHLIIMDKGRLYNTDDAVEFWHIPNYFHWSDANQCVTFLFFTCHQEYHCGSSQGWSENFNFTTWKNGTDWPISLAVFGDMGAVNAQSLPRFVATL